MHSPLWKVSEFCFSNCSCSSYCKQWWFHKLYYLKKFSSWMAWEKLPLAFRATVKGREHKIVDVHPNGSSPIRCIMLCIPLHVKGAKTKEKLTINTGISTMVDNSGTVMIRIIVITLLWQANEVQNWSTSWTRYEGVVVDFQTLASPARTQRP